MTHVMNSGRGSMRTNSKRTGRKTWRRRQHCFAEMLERRQLLAAVSWDGGGDGTNWTDANNWSTNALPQAADDVTISVGANPTILIASGTQSIHSLVSDELIQTTGGTLAVSTTATASQSVTLAGGGLSGGAWTFTGGASVLGTSTGGTLANVAINGDIVLNVSSANVLVSGTTSFSAARLQASNSIMRLASGYVLSSQIIAEGAATGQRSIQFATGGAGTGTIGAAGVIRLAAGCGGNLAIQNSSTATVTNNGTIAVEAAGRTLTIQNTTFTNSANMQVTAGTLTFTSTTTSNPGTITATSGTVVNFGGDWSNAGNLSINAATLNLGGNFSTAGFNFPGFTRTGGTVNLTGTLTNTGSTLALNAATGSWNLANGNINNGTVSQAGGAILTLTNLGGTLSNVALTGGDLLLDTTSANVTVSGTTSFSAARLQNSNTILQLGTGYVLSSLVSAEGAATGQRSVQFATGGTGTGTIAAGTTIRLAPGCGGNLALQNSSTATVTNNGTISAEAAGRTLTVQCTTFNNAALTQITAGTLSFTSTTTSNPGTITAATGTTVNFGGAWSNAGTFNMNAATVNLGGTFATSGFNFPGFTRTGGIVNLTGTLTNTGSTLTLNAATGSWNFSNATINGGTVNQTGGSILALTNLGGTLNNVAMTGGDLLLDTASANVTVMGTTSFSAARLQAGNTNLQLGTGYVLNSLVVAEGATTGQRAVQFATGGTGTGTIAAGTTIRLAAGCGGNLALQNSSAATVTNNGTVSAEASGRSLLIQCTTFNNAALTQVTAGTLSFNSTTTSNAGTISAGSGTTVTFGGSWSSAGNLSITAATLNLGGTFATSGFNFAGFTRAGGIVNLTGTLTNTGSTLTLNAATGTWNFSNGTINNGTVNQTEGSILALTNLGGTLNNVAVTGGDLLFDTASASLLVSGTTSFPAARLQASNALLQFATGYTLNSLVVAEGAATGQRSVQFAAGGIGAGTISPTGSIRLAPGCAGNLVIQNSSVSTLNNNGTISAEAAGRSLFIQNSALANTGTLSVSAGTMAITPGFTNSGQVSVASGATMTIGGALVNPSGAHISTSGKLLVSGLLDLQSGSTAVAPPSGSGLIRANGLQIGAGVTLDLNDNDLIVDYASPAPSPMGGWNGTAYTGLLGTIQQSYNFGAWDGNAGITTTRPDALAGLTTLAVAEASDVLGLSGNEFGTFEGQQVDATTVLIKYTYAGDANMDGVIDGGDYGIIDNFAQVPDAHNYANGDFNLDGVIDGGDYGMIDNNVQAQGAPL